MAVKKGGLGRGLDALLVDNSIENISASSAVKLSFSPLLNVTVKNKSSEDLKLETICILLIQ